MDTNKLVATNTYESRLSYSTLGIVLYDVVVCSCDDFRRW